MSNHFLIIDTYNMISRSKLPWTRVEGKNLLVLSFLRSFIKTIRFFDPDKVIMPFDDYIGNNFRRNILPEYKGDRSARNNQDTFRDEFRRQKELILNLLEDCFPVHTLKYKGYEADDIIAMITRIASDDVNIIIWSSDQDMLQLQQRFSNVKVWDPRIKSYMETPEYDIIAYKALVGDKSDNIKGVKNIGEKTAEKILKSQLEFIKHIASKPERLIEYRKNKRVIDLIENELPIPNNLEYILNRKVSSNYKKLFNFLKNNGFHNFMKNELDLSSFLEYIERKNNDNKREWFFNKGVKNV